MPGRTAAGILIVTAALLLVPSIEGGSELPSLECVKLQRQARIAEMGKEIDLAVKTYNAALEACPDDPLVLMALLQLYRRHELPGEDRARFRAMLVKRLEDTEKEIPPGSLIYLARSPDTDREEQVMILGAVLDRMAAHTGDPRLLEAAGELHYRLEQPDEARKICGRLLELEPGNERRWQCLFLDQEAERWEEALRLVEEILAAGDESPMARMTYIHLLGKLGRPEEVLQAVEELVPEEEAAAQWAKALRYDLLLDLAWELHDTGKDEQAESIFRSVLEMEPDSDHVQRIVLYLYGTEEERESRARAESERREKQTDPHVLLYEGANLLATGDAESAYSLLARAAPALPDSDLAWFNFGLAAIKLEKYEEAVEAFARAAKLAPGRVDCTFHYGIALYRLGRCAESIEMMQRALEIDPKMYQAHYFLYSCHKSLGDAEEAEKSLQIYKEATGQ